MYTIRLENTVTHQIYEQQTEDTNDGGKLYYNFSLSTVDMVDGEYILTVFGENGDVLAEDLLRIGDFNPQTIQYTKGENTFISVELTAKLENKQVYIDKIETTVYPNNGYDGMADVHINAQPLYDSARSEGYDEGYGVGQSEGYPNGYTDGYNKGTEDGYNTGSAEAYPKGYEDGYDSGRTDGYNEGYANGEQVSYGAGYEQGQQDIAENARVLEVTENGFYDSKFSEIPKPDFVTGVYPDGTEFYNFAELTNIVYNTGIKLSENTKVEIWYKPRDLGFISYGGIIGTIEDNTSYAFGLYARTNKGFIGKIGQREYSYNPNDLNKWFHIELSFAEGFVIDGVNYGTYSKNTQYFERYLFINDYDLNANGYYGMIKIDDTIIIPTEEGFLNTNTGTLLEVVEEGTSYSFTNNTPKVPEGELYKTVNVNIAPKINLAKEYIKFGYSTFAEVPKWADFENLTDTTNLFYFCKNLETIELFDTKIVTNATGMFYQCSKLKNLPNNFNFSGCTNLEKIFYGATSLNDYTFLETWIINPLANMNQMIDNKNTTYVPAIPCVGDSSYYESAIFYSSGEYSQLTYFGGWIGRKYKVTKDQCLKKMPNLTRESCISILNNLYDFTGNGETPNSSQGQLKVHQNFINNVGDDITIGTNKGWTITT